MPDDVRTTRLSDPRFVAGLAALIGAFIPLTAVVQGLFESRAASARFEQELRIKYLDRAIDPERTPEYRDGVLEFLIATVDGEDIKAWAVSRREKVKEVLQLKKQNETLISQLEEKGAQIAELSSHHLEGGSDTGNARNLELLESKIAGLEEELAENSRKVQAIDPVEARRESESKLVPPGTDQIADFLRGRLPQEFLDRRRPDF